MSGGCDTCPSGDEACPIKCDTVLVSCSDALSVVIQAILNIGQANGADATSIADAAAAICGTGTLSDTEIAQAIEFGVSRGALFRRIAAEGAEPTYLINGYMFKLNPRNNKYMRFPCFSRVFWATTAPPY